MRVFLQKRLDGSLWPACEMSEKLSRKLSPGEAAEVDWKSRNTRSVKWHKRYWALCNLIYQNCEYITVGGERIKVRSPQHVHLILKALAGMFDGMVNLPDGTRAMLIASIAFDAMTAEEWADAWFRIVTVVHTEILPGVSESDLENEIAKVAA